MSEKTNNENQSPKNDEIDLLQLFKIFGDFIVRIVKGLFNIILQFIIFSIRKWIYLILAVVLGLGLSYLLSTIQQDIFYSDLVLKSNAVQNQEIIPYLNRLGSLQSEVNYATLASLINISMEDVEEIIDLRAYWFIDKNRDGIVDEVDINDRFLTDTNVYKIEWKFGLRATVTDPMVFSKIAPGIAYYVYSNDYFNQMNKVRLNNLEEIIEQIAKEVEKLDSLQKKEYFKLENTTRLKEGQLVFTNDQEIKLFHTDLLDLVKLKQASLDELTIHSNIISILEDFTITQSPANNAMFYALKLIPAFIVIAYLLAFYITFRGKILEVMRK